MASRGTGDAAIHQLAWDAFVKGTEVAKQEGLYGAGQDLLKTSFSGNVKGMGPAVAEMEIDERPAEPFLFFAADKTDPGAFNLPLYLAFADPMNTPGLLLSPKMSKGFRFVIMDVNHTEGDRLIELNAPENLYDIATLLRDPERFVVESVWSRSNGEQAAVVAACSAMPVPLPALPASWQPGDSPVKVTISREDNNDVALVVFEVTTLDGKLLTIDSAPKNPAHTLAPFVVATSTTVAGATTTSTSMSPPSSR